MSKLYGTQSLLAAMALLALPTTCLAGSAEVTPVANPAHEHIVVVLSYAKNEKAVERCDGTEMNSVELKIYADGTVEGRTERRSCKNQIMHAQAKHPSGRIANDQLLLLWHKLGMLVSSGAAAPAAQSDAAEAPREELDVHAGIRLAGDERGALTVYEMPGVVRYGADAEASMGVIQAVLPDQLN